MRMATCAAAVLAICLTAVDAWAPAAVARIGMSRRSSFSMMSSPTTIKGPGCVFPRDTAEGWFDTTSVGMPVVHRCAWYWQKLFVHVLRCVSLHQAATVLCVFQ
jgi:hypothetical protein